MRERAFTPRDRFDDLREREREGGYVRLRCHTTQEWIDGNGNVFYPNAYKCSCLTGFFYLRHVSQDHKISQVSVNEQFEKQLLKRD